MLLLKVYYQLSFLKYLIHELVSQRHLLIEKCWTVFLLAADTVHFNSFSFIEILIVIFHVRRSADENAQFSLISYLKERRFSVFQTSPDYWKYKKPLQVLMWFLNKYTIEIIFLGKIWRKSKLHDCQPIFENYRQWLLRNWLHKFRFCPSFER